MTPMHPHWQSTDDEAIVPVRSKTNQASAPVRVSRAPAAVVGIALMVGVVAYSFGGLDAVIGQLTNPTPDVTVRVRQGAVDPEIATIMPGQTIRWVNDDQIPHVLSSQTLPTSDGEPFTTSAMFQNGEAFYTAPATAPEGTYDYISQTSPDVAGQIVISNTPVAASSASSVAAEPASSVPTLSSVPAVAQSSSSSVAPLPLPTQPTSSVAPSPVGANVIAVNPYVVGAKASSSRKPGVVEHKPTTNAGTGPAVWIVLGCSAAGLVLASRGAFRRV